MNTKKFNETLESSQKKKRSREASLNYGNSWKKIHEKIRISADGKPCPICKRILDLKAKGTNWPTIEHIFNREYFQRNEYGIKEKKQNLRRSKFCFQSLQNITVTCTACNDARNHAKQKTSLSDSIRYNSWSLLQLTDVNPKLRAAIKRYTKDIDSVFWNYLKKKHGVHKP